LQDPYALAQGQRPGGGQEPRAAGRWHLCLAVCLRGAPVNHARSCYSATTTFRTSSSGWLTAVPKSFGGGF
jgi:hypothetical protein